MTKRISNDDLIAELRGLSEGPNSPPTWREMVRDGTFHPTTYGSRWGSWNAALKAAGFSVNKRHEITNTEILDELRGSADGRVAPSRQEFNEESEFSFNCVTTRFESRWRGYVTAGLIPRNRRPLTETQFRQYHTAAQNLPKASWELTALMAMFTGLTSDVFGSLSDSWVDIRQHDILITVPGAHTATGEAWEFRLPETWTTDGNTVDTGLPGLLRWFSAAHSLPIGGRSLYQNSIYRAAANADLENREQVTTPPELAGTQVPLVRPSDLRVTGGVRMARKGVPERRIRRHLGLQHTGAKTTVRDCYIWCDVHDDDFDHPDYDRPDFLE